ncbi:branched-chain amino acid transport system II carrier protein [Candidatus Albibeggiatoa sp. nov. BB20]|uniref:branched-chain amino acid transport system II carrier protein n=1 Tax=Candidatus Albibeggiatoa sp. nov. BB20 TaxID=3162723 RepID=UPI0033658368
MSNLYSCSLLSTLGNECFNISIPSRNMIYPILISLMILSSSESTILSIKYIYRLYLFCKTIKYLSITNHLFFNRFKYLFI